MTVLRVAAVQASYVLMDRDATIDRVRARHADRIDTHPAPR
jgi:hypothetical protein